jgi:predicted CoA-binding protein
LTSKSSVENFLSQKNIAVVGVSRNSKKFGNTIYRSLKKKGYNVFPINPNAEKIEGDNCYPDLLSLPEKIDAVVINVPPEETEKVVLKVNKAGIKRVWLQQGSQSEKAINFSQENGIDCVSNECILMLS